MEKYKKRIDCNHDFNYIKSSGLPYFTIEKAICNKCNLYKIIKMEHINYNKDK